MANSTPAVSSTLHSTSLSSLLNQVTESLTQGASLISTQPVHAVQNSITFQNRTSFHKHVKESCYPRKFFFKLVLQSKHGCSSCTTFINRMTLCEIKNWTPDWTFHSCVAFHVETCSEISARKKSEQYVLSNTWYKLQMAPSFTIQKSMN